MSSKSTYRLPCVYCNNNVTFPSSEKLKEHLLSNHKSMVCGSRQSIAPPPERPSSEINMAKKVPSASPMKITKSHQDKLTPVTHKTPSTSYAAYAPSSLSSSCYQSKYSSSPSKIMQQGSPSTTMGLHQTKTNTSGGALLSPASFLSQTKQQLHAGGSTLSSFQTSGVPVHPQSSYLAQANYTQSGNSPGSMHAPTGFVPSAKLSRSGNSLTSLHAPSSGQILHSRSELDMVSSMQEKKMNRLKDALDARGREIERLQAEIENLKVDGRNKEEEQSRVRQRWRKEAEDALRNLKTNYKDVLTQKRLMEKQLEEVDGEKEKLRAKNDQLEKDLADVQAKVSSKKRYLQMNLTEQDGGGGSASQASTVTDTSEKEMTQLLSADLQATRKENLSLAEALTSKGDTLKNCKSKLTKTEEGLLKEEKINHGLKKEVNSLKEKISQLSRGEEIPNMLHRSISSLALKLDESQKSHNGLKNEMKKYVEENENLENLVKNLKDEKARLVNKLQSADDALVNISSKMPSVKGFPISKHASSGVFSQVNLQQSTMETNNSLDEVLHILKQLPNRFQPAETNTIELNHVTAELHRVNLQLVEEKANVCQLKQSMAELEQAAADENDLLKERDQKSTELQKLRAQHQSCAKNEKVRKQLLREKKMLQRKCSSAQQEYKLLNALYQSSTTDLTAKDYMLSELLSDKKRIGQSSESMTEELKQSQKTAREREKLLEKYKRESSYLLEKLNTSNEDREEIKKRNEIMEERLDELMSFTDIKKSLAVLQTSVHELKTKAIESKTLDPKVSVDLQEVYKKNNELVGKISSLENQISSDKQAVNSLHYTIKQKSKDIVKLENQLDQYKDDMDTKASQAEMQSSMNESNFKSQLENLKLENEIIQSRVLILEGISQEMDILTVERDHLKQENRKLKETVATSRKNLRQGKRAELVLVNNLMESEPSIHDQMVESIKTLEQLDDENKLRLQQMLATPEFESFLSNEEIHLDLHYSDQSTAANAISSNKSDSRQSSYEREHTINHMYQASSDTLMATEDSASYEDVIQVYSPTIENMEETIDYGEKTQSVENLTTLLHSQINDSKSTPSPSHQDQNKVNKKNLEKLFSESKLISKDIAAKRDEVDYKKVLTEFQKVISHMSGPSSSSHSSLDERKNSSFIRHCKRVTFSDQLNKLGTEGDNRNQSSGGLWTTTTTTSPSTATEPENLGPDSKFYKSFFQDALKRTFPILAKYEDEDMAVDGVTNDHDISVSSLDSPIKSNSLTDQAKTLIMSEENFVKEQSSDILSFEELVNMVSTGSEMDSSSYKMADPLLLSKALIQMKSTERLKSSSQQLPTLDEEEHGGEMEDKHGNPAVALRVLNSFINKADHGQMDAIASTQRQMLNNYLETGDNIAFPGYEFATNNRRNYENYENYRNDDTMLSSVAAAAADNGDLLANSYDAQNLIPASTYEDFGSSLFRDHNTANLLLDNSRLQIPGTRGHMVSTPSVPSTLHEPTSLDFSDISLPDSRLFSHSVD